jgi:predicted kinase
MKAILTIGIPCSGKSTWAEQYCRENIAVEINRDNIRMEMFGLERYNDYKMTKEKESYVSEVGKEKIELCAKTKQDIVISDTNLNKKYRNELIKKLESLGYDVEIKIFDIEYFDAIKRNDKRKDKQIPRSVMYDMYRRYMEFLEEEGEWEKHTHSPELQNAYIVDIDGTIASNTSNRGFYDWANVGMDDPIPETIKLVNMLHDDGNKIIIFTGRDASCELETLNWLINHGVEFDALHMRPRGSMIKDRFVKHDMYKEHIVGKYNVRAVFDDRPQVSLLWHDLGIQLFKVGGPLREF